MGERCIRRHVSAAYWRRKRKDKTTTVYGNVKKVTKEAATKASSKTSDTYGKIKSAATKAVGTAAKRFEDSSIGKKIVDPILAGTTAARRRYMIEKNANRPYAEYYPQLKAKEKAMGERHPRLKTVVNKATY